MQWISLALILVQLSTTLASTVSNASKITFQKYPIVNEGLGWRVILIRKVPVFIVHEGFQFSKYFHENRIVSNRGILGSSVCPKDTGVTHKIVISSGGNFPSTHVATRIIMLKLATTGSSWAGGLLQDLPHVKFRSELISGSGGSHLTDVQKIGSMGRALRNDCEDKVLCGFSINAKNGANLDFPSFAAAQNAIFWKKQNRATPTSGWNRRLVTSYPLRTNEPVVRVVVWVRSNLVAYAVGLWRAHQLTSGPCHSNNQRGGSSKRAKKCALPSSNVTMPLGAFVENLKKAQFFHAINLGAAYRHWKPPALQVPPCADKYAREGITRTSPQAAGSFLSSSSIERVPIYELYYEDMLRDKDGTLKALLAWLGVNEEFRVPADKFVKSTPATLHGLLQNFDEIRAWLSGHSQCLLAHLLDSDGTRVMPPCPFLVNPEDVERLFVSVARRKRVDTQHRIWQ